MQNWSEISKMSMPRVISYLCFLLIQIIIDATNSMKSILEKTGVEYCKVTHLRMLALQFAGFAGLAPYQVNTLTNHMLDKQHRAYQSVTEKEVSTFF